MSANLTDQVPNLMPGTFQTTQTPNSIDKGLRILDAPVDSRWSKPNQQFKEYNLNLPTNVNNEVNKTAKNYAYSMLRGVQIVTEFSLLFFSWQNIAEIQKALKYAVFTISGMRISNQSETDLVVIMRETYMEYSRVPKQQKDYTEAITILNDIVMERALRIVLSGATQYRKYLFDSSNQPTPNSYGVNSSVAGTKNLRDISDVIFAKTSNVYSNVYNN